MAGIGRHRHGRRSQARVCGGVSGKTRWCVTDTVKAVRERYGMLRQSTAYHAGCVRRSKWQVKENVH